MFPKKCLLYKYCPFWFIDVLFSLLFAQLSLPLLSQTGVTGMWNATAGQVCNDPRAAEDKECRGGCCLLPSVELSSCFVFSHEQKCFVNCLTAEAQGVVAAPQCPQTE